MGGALAFRAAGAFVAALATSVLVKVIGYDSRTEFLALVEVVCGLSLALSQPYIYLGGGLAAVLLTQAAGVAGARPPLANGGIGSILAFWSSEVLILTAFRWLLLRMAVDRSVLRDFLRAAATAGGTRVRFWAQPSVTPWLAVPACVAVFIALALACGLVLRTDLGIVANLIRDKLERLRIGAKGQERGRARCAIQPTKVRERRAEAPGYGWTMSSTCMLGGGAA